MSQDQSTRILLKIEDENIKNLKVQDSPDGVIRITGELSYAISVCPRCGKAEMVRNGHKTVVTRLPRVSEQTTLLILRKQRFRCKDCGKTLLAQTSLVQRQHQISNNTLHAIDLALTDDRTMSSIAEQYNVSTNTISRRLVLLGKETRPVFNSLPTTICIDEFRSTGKQMSFIAV